MGYMGKRAPCMGNMVYMATGQQSNLGNRVNLHPYFLPLDEASFISKKETKLSQPIHSIYATDILSHQIPNIIPSILISWFAALNIFFISPLLVEHFFTLKLRRPIRANLVRAAYRLTF